MSCCPERINLGGNIVHKSSLGFMCGEYSLPNQIYICNILYSGEYLKRLIYDINKMFLSIPCRANSFEGSIYPYYSRIKAYKAFFESLNKNPEYYEIEINFSSLKEFPGCNSDLLISGEVVSSILVPELSIDLQDEIDTFAAGIITYFASHKYIQNLSNPVYIVQVDGLVVKIKVLEFFSQSKPDALPANFDDWDISFSDYYGCNGSPMQLKPDVIISLSEPTTLYFGTRRGCRPLSGFIQDVAQVTSPNLCLPDYGENEYGFIFIGSIPIQDGNSLIPSFGCSEECLELIQEVIDEVGDLSVQVQENTSTITALKVDKIGSVSLVDLDADFTYAILISSSRDGVINSVDYILDGDEFSLSIIVNGNVITTINAITASGSSSVSVPFQEGDLVQALVFSVANTTLIELEFTATYLI